MSQPETEPKIKPPPEIDCSESIELISEGNRPEQYHQFEAGKRSGHPGRAGGQAAAAGAGKAGRRQDPARGGRGEGAQAAAGARVSSTRGPRHATCSGNSMR